MVGHTHQDYLPRSATYGSTSQGNIQIDLSCIKNFTEPYELFDCPGRYFRKVSVSYLDEVLDDLGDWHRFTCALTGIDMLYIIDDRTIINPIMSAYANELNSRYIAMLQSDGIPASIVSAH